MLFTLETDGNNKLLSLNIEMFNVNPRGTHDCSVTGCKIGTKFSMSRRAIILTQTWIEISGYF